MARLYTWMRTKRIALAFCALTLLGAAGVWALQERQQPAGGPSALPAAGAAGGDGAPFSWPYEITEHSSMPRDLSFAEAKADFEQMVGEEVDMVGTAGAWAEISTPGTLLDVPLDVFEGPPPPEITVAYDFAIYFGAYGAAFERVSGVAYELVFVGEFSAAYAPPLGPEIVQWGSELAPDPDLSAALAQAFADMGEGGGVYVMPSAMLRVEDPYVSTWQPTPIDTWRAGGNFLYEFKAPPNQPPEAVASADPTVVAVGQSIQFSGEGSSDPDGDPLTYYWDFKDGGWSTDKKTRHTYTQPDTYKVTLTVHDSQSESDTAEVEVMAVGASFDRDPVVVGVAKTETVTATVSPSPGFPYVTFSTGDPTIATVEPATATGPSQELTIYGLKKGITTLEARVNGDLCGSVTVRVGRVDFIRITPDPGLLTPGERTIFMAVGFAAVEGYPPLPSDYSPDLSMQVGTEVAFATDTGTKTRGVFLGPIPVNWQIVENPQAQFFIPPDVPTEDVPTVEVEAFAHAVARVRPDVLLAGTRVEKEKDKPVGGGKKDDAKLKSRKVAYKYTKKDVDETGHFYKVQFTGLTGKTIIAKVAITFTYYIGGKRCFTLAANYYEAFDLNKKGQAKSPDRHAIAVLAIPGQLGWFPAVHYDKCVVERRHDIANGEVKDVKFNKFGFAYLRYGDPAIKLESEAVSTLYDPKTGKPIKTDKILNPFKAGKVSRIMTKGYLSDKATLVHKSTYTWTIDGAGNQKWTFKATWDGKKDIDTNGKAKFNPRKHAKRIKEVGAG